ncbi:maleylpyruvate isomerase family mycothiol-dependent enzyme [Prauserella cavernicola]|uniref:Maleylpyruvate isomerase family mycothiol-dependent enzyme n=1 Tax=Prauserella cavernicola TaxID=2800127 RepID=A0A934QXG1_9PSEU|nr:maleylpyruvate isomerase family mycothiol-dependent enzyme [Prauserella cavernicola]MBK1787073.1 maleylpyruvate isomerase family mycothiol-dependent enzyme [Prauserella cavernicola]
MSALWPLVHTERAALAHDLTGLTGEQWATPSLCAGLSVREVLAHLTSAATLNGVRWFAGVLRCRFDFDRQVAMRLAEQLGADGAETFARFRGVVGSTTRPPLPVVAILGETIVHGEDIRRPLDLRRDHPIATLTHVAEYYRRSDMVVPGRTRGRGLRLAATDGPLAAGEGPLVTGTTLALTMALAGRDAFAAELEGDGAEILRTRCAA